MWPRVMASLPATGGHENHIGADGHPESIVADKRDLNEHANNCESHKNKRKRKSEVHKPLPGVATGHRTDDPTTALSCDCARSTLRRYRYLPDDDRRSVDENMTVVDDNERFQFGLFCD